MEHTYEMRGKLAFIQDQAEQAAAAFRAQDPAAMLSILQELELYLGTFLHEIEPKRK